MLLQAEEGAGRAAGVAAVDRVRHAVAGLDKVTLPPATARQAEVALRRTGTAMLALHSEKSSDRQIDSAAELREDLDPGTAVNGVTTYLAGQPTIWAGMQELSKKDLSKAEAGGFPIVAIILLVVFGSLAAAVLPLVLGFVSVMVTGALIYFISLQIETSVFVTNMASMIGIGVAIDYSLFILARYREERAAGRDPEAARAEALSTSGLAVAFSGLAVIVSLAGLWMVDNQALRSMALGAMTVVAVSILTATTLLPALIAMLGDRVLPGGIVAKVLGVFRRRGEQPDREAFWVRWTARVMARPWAAVIGVSAVLLTLAIPLLSIETGTQAINAVPHGQRRADRQRTRLQAARRRHRPGADGRLVRERRPARTDRAAITGFARTIEATPGVSAVAPPAFSGRSVLIQATPSAPSESDATHRPGRTAARQRRAQRPRSPTSPASTSVAKPPAARTPAPRSVARCGRSSSSCSRSATWC